MVHASVCNQPCRQRTIPNLYTESDSRPVSQESMAGKMTKTTCSPLFIFRTAIILSCFNLVAATEQNVKGKCSEVIKKESHDTDALKLYSMVILVTENDSR